MSEHQQNQDKNIDIVDFDPREHVRLRPGMYVGGRDKRAMHYLIYEVLDHSVELASTDQCDHIWITLRDNNEVCIRDNGTEIPVDIDKATGRPLLEIFMTHVGVSNERVHGFPEKRYTGLHSMGLWAINALTELSSIEGTYQGYLWRQVYKEGVPQAKVTKVRALEADEMRGITITFRPDFSILENNDFDYDEILARAREMAYVASGATITISDERNSPALKGEFHFPNGMADLVRAFNKGRATLHDVVHYRGTWSNNTEHRQERYDVEFALQYTDSNDTVIRSYVNTFRMDGGTHLRGLQSAVVDVINAENVTKTETPLTWDEIKGGLTIGLNVKMADPQFESQARIVLMNPAASDAVAKVVRQGLNDENFYTIIKKFETSRRTLRS